MMNEIPNNFSLLILINVNMQCHVRDDYSPSILADLKSSMLQITVSPSCKFFWKPVWADLKIVRLSC